MSPTRKPNIDASLVRHNGERSSSVPKVPRKPGRWPEGIKYLTALEFAPSIPKEVVIHIKVVIRCIENPSHPAHRQFGLFASKKIPANTRIIDYLGVVHVDDRPSSNYDLSLYRTQDGLINVGVDASCMGNEARFINDYRGVKPKPNANFKDGRTMSGELRMSVWSGNQSIGKGEEILVSYGKSWWNARNEPPR